MKKELLILRKFIYIMLKESGNVTWYFLYKHVFETFCDILYLCVLDGIFFFFQTQIHCGESN